ncbi:(S)-3-O-geranylgeranylglyceryl phosphate synthase [Chitinispirillum alkaliphilum]|nr:(S)-3-O-geranylgeranylglyceryl phosphate synthase [Chitinispirillum alkaliphilum]
MKIGSFLQSVLGKCSENKRMYWVLLDPDDFTIEEAKEVSSEAQRNGVDAILVGGSLLHSNHFDLFIQTLKQSVNIPVVIFPGDSAQLSSHADALLYLSLISGRNPVNLIGEHVKAAPLIRQTKLEPVATAYMLVESGAVSSVEFMSNTRPLPRTKPTIAAAHALAAQYMGMKVVYLEAGSGAPMPVPSDMVKAVRSYVDIPIIVGGGIRDAATAREKLEAGADIIVTGNIIQQKNGISVMQEIASMVKSFK